MSAFGTSNHVLAKKLTRPISPTAPTTNLALITCATTWSAKSTSCASAIFTYAIVDEVDSILIDEARTPLIISAPSVTSGSAYAQFAKVVRSFKEQALRNRRKAQNCHLDRRRRRKNRRRFWASTTSTALRISAPFTTWSKLCGPRRLFNRDKDYVVTNEGEVVIVDEFTGRLLAGRRYNEGLHQAIEAKEGVEVQEESMTLATISFQNYFRLYENCPA